MDTPNIELIMPRTELFTGTTGAGQLLRTDTVDYVYLPKGTSMVQVVATGLAGVRIHVDLYKKGVEKVTLAVATPSAETERIYTATFANANELSAGMWLKVWVSGLTAAQAATGTVGITITPMQVE